MSPFIAVLALVVIGGAILCVGGLVLRKWRLTAICTPFVLLILLWFFLAGNVPDAATEMVRVFGSNVAARASGVKIEKPMFMDGHLISFGITQSDFQQSVRPKFTSLAAGSVMQSRTLPAGWPESIERAPAFQMDLERQSVIITYDAALQRAFASVWYEQW